jgi:UDP-2-acetamido-2,6-beta-L-arabino-hexul-4-ose reductase
MLKVGITGQSGFVGTHLFNTLGLFPDSYERIPFQDSFFSDQSILNSFIKRCDVVVHFAALSRHNKPNQVYDTNLKLVNQLITGLEQENVQPYILFSSSIQEENQSEYGKSKLEGRILLEKWAKRNNANFTGMIFPNIYGPFGKPNYVSFIATFCHKLSHGEPPVINIDNEVRLIYISNLVKQIINKIEKTSLKIKPCVETYIVPFDFKMKVTETLRLFENYKSLYYNRGIIPELKENNELNLFNTFRSYINHKQHFPVKITKDLDWSQWLINTIKLGNGEQLSLSTSVLSINSGNHCLMSNIERITVVKGKAKLQLCRVGTSEVLDFYLEGKEPSYVDVPIWYTYTITNIGLEELIAKQLIKEWDKSYKGNSYFKSGTI